MVCPKCGYQNNGGAKFCAKCGLELAAGTGNRENGGQQPGTPNDKQLIKALLAVGIIIVILLAGILGTLIGKSINSDPAPTLPAPTQPAPTQPEPTQPAPTQPEPTQPAPTQPEPTQPAPTQPEPTQPAPTQPEPTQPAPTQPEPTQPEPTQSALDAVPESEWINNIMAEEPLDIFKMERKLIRSVTFLDSTENAPEKPWGMGEDGSRRVLGWVEWSGSKADIYFAADGGINAEKCCKSMFKDCNNLEEINFNGAFHTKYAKSMSEMFRDCKALTWLDVSGFDTSGCTSMYGMFSTCTTLKTLDLSNFDTSNVTNMGYMFSACRNMETVYVENFDTSKVYNMEGMFRWCEKLKHVDVSSWDFSGVTEYSNFMDGKSWKSYFQ